MPRHILFCLTIVAFLAGATAATAQDGERGRRGRSSRGNFDPAEMLKRMDANGNGSIEPSEMSDRGRGFIERLAEQGGLDAKQPLPIDKLIESSNRMRAEREAGGGERRDRDRGEGDGDNNDRRADDRRDNSDKDESESSSPATPTAPTTSPTTSLKTPLTPGFGEKPTQPAAAGFDVPLGEDNANLAGRYSEEVLESVERMLRDYDKNSDGFLDSEEQKANKWSTPPEPSDTNKDGKLSKSELCARKKLQFAQRSGERSQDDEKGKPSSSGSQAKPNEEAEKYRSFAESLLKQHDKDKSGYLEKSKGEWDDLKKEHYGADANGDGAISVDELIVKLQAFSSGAASSSSSAGSRTAGSSPRKAPWWKAKEGKDAAKTEPKKSYRFASPTERLPKGLPDWFARNDADADGQVMMAEFAASWTESTATEFAKFDLDGDGVITADECVASNTKAPAPGSATGGGASGSTGGSRDGKRR